MKAIVRFEKMGPSAIIPTRATAGSAGLDLYASDRAVISPGGTVLVSTGIRMQLPDGYEGQIRARSSLAMKGIIVTNGPGTIDADYRGEIKVLLTNLGHGTVIFEKDSRIAQLVIHRLAPIAVEEAPVAQCMTRGARGFGSTGK